MVQSHISLTLCRTDFCSPPCFETLFRNLPFVMLRLDLCLLLLWLDPSRWFGLPVVVSPSPSFCLGNGQMKSVFCAFQGSASNFLLAWRKKWRKKMEEVQQCQEQWSVKKSHLLKWIASGRTVGSERVSFLNLKIAQICFWFLFVFYFYCDAMLWGADMQTACFQLTLPPTPPVSLGAPPRHSPTRAHLVPCVLSSSWLWWANLFDTHERRPKPFSVFLLQSVGSFAAQKTPPVPLSRYLLVFLLKWGGCLFAHIIYMCTYILHCGKDI